MVHLLLLLGLSPLLHTASAFAPAPSLTGQEPTRVLITQRDGQARLRRGPAWQSFVQGEGKGWQARFDEATGTAHRAWGAGIPIGPTQTAAQVEAGMRAFFLRNPALLGGVSPDDLHLGRAQQSGDRWIVRFDRVVRVSPAAEKGRVVGRDAALDLVRLPAANADLPSALGELAAAGEPVVWKGGVEVRLQQGRLVMLGIDTHPAADTVAPLPAISADAAIQLAISEGLAPEAEHLVEGAVLVVLPLETDAGLEYRLSWMVRSRTGLLAAAAPVGIWRSLVDAQTGELLAQYNEVRYASGTVYGTHDTRVPNGDMSTSAFPWMDITSGGGSTTTDEDGKWSLSGSSFTATLEGDWVTVENSSGGEGSLTWSSGSATWTTTAATQAEIDTFLFQNQIHVWGVTWAPELDISNQQMAALVNINDVCNAYYDGNVNFYKSGSGCNNTGQMADVSYHEWGHGFHAYCADTWSVDGSVGEGAGDAVSFFNTGDSEIAPYFMTSGDSIRDAGPNRAYPDDIVGEVHEDGLIFAGAIWDLWGLLDGSLGAEDGYATSVTLFKETLKANPTIEVTYDELVAADDDDADLSNGTPNQCEIIEAFGPHGLGPTGGTGALLGLYHPPVENQPPTATSYPLDAELLNYAPGCVESTLSDAVVRYSIDGGATWSEAPLTASATGVAGAIPAVAPGTVVTYYIEAQSSDGAAVTAPTGGEINPFSFFVGELVEISCFDFEDDDGGFTHELLSGSDGEGADDWVWSRPRGAGGDPSEAVSGTKVWGNDLGGGNFNGQYQENKTNRLTSPAIDTSGYERVFLQYRRWLQVEDGYFDKASIYANDAVVWQNHESSRSVGDEHTADDQWALHTLELPAADSTALGWEIESDAGLNFGGWTLDDVCVYGYVAPVEPIDSGDPEDSGTPDGDTGGAGDGPGGEGDGGASDLVGGGAGKGGFTVCGCSSSSGAGGATGSAGLVLGAAALLLRRRRPSERA